MSDESPAFPPVRGHEEPFSGPRLPVAPEFDRRRGAERRSGPRAEGERRGAAQDDEPRPRLPPVPLG